MTQGQYRAVGDGLQLESGLHPTPRGALELLAHRAVPPGPRGAVHLRPYLARHSLALGRTSGEGSHAGVSGQGGCFCWLRAVLWKMVLP